MAASAGEVQAPDRWRTTVFQAKACCLRLQRLARDLAKGRPSRHPRAESLRDAPILAAFNSPLWPGDEVDPMLVMGKIQNLRLAARRLDGLEVPAGSVFSFWRQLGRATQRRGYAIGRELREGCLIPALGGGLCQLSNAMYDCALRAGIVVAERHRHSRVLPGSLAEQDRDATVFWNYIDLRLHAPFAWRLEVSLDESALKVAIRGIASDAGARIPIASRSRIAQETADCTSCGKQDCHRHTGRSTDDRHRTWLVHEDWPEFAAYRQHDSKASDRLLGIDAVPSWSERWTRLYLRAHRRFLLWRKQPLPSAQQHGHEVVARRLAARLRPDDIDLVIPQALLPYLWLAGELGGRRFSVTMTALPMTHIHAQLDRAAKAHAASPTLRDFRAPAALMAAERQALAQAYEWITPHSDIARIAGRRAVLLDWIRSSPAETAPKPRYADPVRLLLPAPSLARKGAYELREALRGLQAQLLLPPGAWESPDFWDGYAVRRVDSIASGLASADVVVLPAWVEHQPRGLLAALALGLPTIATSACGLPATMPWIPVPEGDAESLRAAIDQLIAAP